VGAKSSGSSDPIFFFLPRMKRQRENRLELEEEIAAIKIEIYALKAALARWETKAEAAEKAGRADEAKEHLGRYDTVNTQLASLQNRLYLKESALVADESMVKREKGTDLGNAFLFAHYTF
jgi:chromosome segregation ATPase